MTEAGMHVIELEHKELLLTMRRSSEGGAARAGQCY
jgi:hypothetical protein